MLQVCVLDSCLDGSIFNMPFMEGMHLVLEFRMLMLLMDML